MISEADEQTNTGIKVEVEGERNARKHGDPKRPPPRFSYLGHVTDPTSLKIIGNNTACR